jgi:hypothetical protein
MITGRFAALRRPTHALPAMPQRDFPNRELGSYLFAREPE